MTREEPYKLVWARPMTKVSRDEHTVAYSLEPTTCGVTFGVKF